ncbi:hypothetical protein PRUPE_1G316000 [Prunus persica]|uniref:Uncharacterized protein n=1 Tax=Prunus persica TaxID=3760 RepID=A0A251R663_PRUPE|nr:hypothetical protein PRUPE_1G316000 [Prunus persica]
MCIYDIHLITVDALSSYSFSFERLLLSSEAALLAFHSGNDCRFIPVKPRHATFFFVLLAVSLQRLDIICLSMCR